MPVQPTYPGVYIEEVPSGVRPITGVATSIGAFVDYFRRGPLDLPVRLFSPADFEREFGGLDARSEASYAIRQFFLNGGGETYAVRVSPAGDLATAATLLVTGGAVSIFNTTAGRRIRGGSVADPGEWGNFLRLEVDYDTVQPNELIDTGGVQVAAELFNLTVTEVVLRDGRTLEVQSERFPNLTMRPAARNNAVEVVNEGSKLAQLDRNGLAALMNPPERPDATGTQGAALPGTWAPIANSSAFNIDVDPISGPVISRPASIQYQGAPVPATAAAFRPFLQAAIRAAEPANPLFSGAVVRLERNRFRVTLGRAGAGFEPTATITFANGATADALSLSANGGGVVNSQQLPLTGGDDGGLPDAAALRGVRASRTGMYALEDADLFNILCIPRAAAITANDGADMRQVYLEATAYCEERRSFLIVDVPENTDFDDMQTWLDDNNGLRHRNAADGVSTCLDHTLHVVVGPRTPSHEPPVRHRIDLYGVLKQAVEQQSTRP